MTRAQVRIAGRPLRSLGAVADLVDSTIFRTEGWSGDYQASCTVSRARSGQAPWLRRGALWETLEAGRVTWSGFVDEVTPDDGTLKVSAYGRGSRATDFPALAGGPTVYTPSYAPNSVVDAAEARGLGFSRRGADVGSSAVAVAPGEVDSVAGILDRAAAARGQRWWVNATGTLSYRSPAAVKWVLRPGETYMGTADDEYLTRLWGLYVSAVDANNEPTAWEVTFANGSTAVETALRARWGPREMPVVDLTALGVQHSATTARADLAGRFARVGGRMGWTNGLELTTTNMRRLATAVPAPLAVRAGDRILAPGVVDNGTAGTYRPTLELTLGEVTRHHDELRTSAAPIGLAPRGFAAALEAAQAPPEVSVPA